MPEEDRKPHPSPFVRWLEEQGSLPALEDAMAEMVRNVAEVGKAGELSMKVKFKPEGEGKMTMTLTHANKLPKADSEPRTFFITEGAKLSRNNPKQRVLTIQPKAQATA